MLVPVIAAAGVAFLVKRFAPEAKGHGVPDVMDAIYYRQGGHPPRGRADQGDRIRAVDWERALGRP